MESISRQFMCCVPWKQIVWEIDPANLNETEQEILLKATAFHPVNMKHPISATYQRNFFKKVISDLENNGQNVCEKLYEYYVKILNDDESSRVHKSYYIPCIDSFIPIREHKQFLSCGTTGLTTWPGALFLAEWCLENKDKLQNKKILELGSGAGLLGIIVCKVCNPAVYSFTDYHSDVLSLLDLNVRLNFDPDYDARHARGDVNADISEYRSLKVRCSKNASDVDGNRFMNVQIHSLDWCVKTSKLEDFLNEERRPDVILAADVVFDPSLVPDLVRTLAFLLSKSNKSRNVLKTTSYVSVTVRNPDTFDVFMEELAKKGLSSEQGEMDNSVVNAKLTYRNGDTKEFAYSEKVENLTDLYEDLKKLQRESNEVLTELVMLEKEELKADSQKPNQEEETEEDSSDSENQNSVEPDEKRPKRKD